MVMYLNFLCHPDSLRPDEAASPVTSYFSLKSNQSMDRPIAFKDRTQPYSVKRYENLHSLIRYTCACSVSAI